jgi:hypothetical protein
VVYLARNSEMKLGTKTRNSELGRRTRAALVWVSRHRHLPAPSLPPLTGLRLLLRRVFFRSCVACVVCTCAVSRLVCVLLFPASSCGFCIASSFLVLMLSLLHCAEFPRTHALTGLLESCSKTRRLRLCTRPQSHFNSRAPPRPLCLYLDSSQIRAHILALACLGSGLPNPGLGIFVGSRVSRPGDLPRRRRTTATAAALARARFPPS